jgi:hypothetical protein
VTFNHGVEGSSPSALTKQNQYLIASSENLRICPCGQTSCRSILRKTDRRIELEESRAVDSAPWASIAPSRRRFGIGRASRGRRPRGLPDPCARSAPTARHGAALPGAARLCRLPESRRRSRSWHAIIERRSMTEPRISFIGTHAMAARRHRCPRCLPPSLLELGSVRRFTGDGGSRYGLPERRGLKSGANGAAGSIECMSSGAGRMPLATLPQRHSSRQGS